MEAKEPKKNKIDELIEHGKAKGVLTYKEVMDALRSITLLRRVHTAHERT